VGVSNNLDKSKTQELNHSLVMDNKDKINKKLAWGDFVDYSAFIG
jgi:hypothetical protein